MSEILAPAGDKNSLIAAINNGADAVYLGLKQFSARSSAENFDLQNFEEIVDYCHAFNVKVYVAMNTLVKESEVQDFISALLEVWNKGCDAIIISDVFLGKFLKQNYPEIVLHLSTQAGVCNKYAAILAKEYGFSRVILSRETAFDDVKEIAGQIETEVFVQGALCTCFSGQCYMSSFAGGNSGNRGRCKQQCRKMYTVDRSGYDDFDYKISLSDLCVGEDVQKLVEAGVYSFKIEGRMRRPEYVAAAVKYYRNILDKCPKNDDLSELKRVYNRGNYTRGLTFGQDKTFISSNIQGHIGEFAGIIKVENGKYVCKCSQIFENGDGFKILRDGKEVGGAICCGAVKGGIILSSKSRLKNGDKAFITSDSALNSRLLSKKSLISVKIDAKFAAGKRAEIYLNGQKFESNEILSQAKNQPLSVSDIQKCFKKTDKYPFDVIFGDIYVDNVFVAAAELNALRREIYCKMYSIMSSNNNKKYSKTHVLPVVEYSKCHKTAVILPNFHTISADIAIFKISDFSQPDVSSDCFKGEKFLYLPPYMTGEEIKNIKPAIKSFDGIYCDGIYAVKLCEELNVPMFAGTGFNISNSVDVTLCRAKYVALSKELTATEAGGLVCENTFYLKAGDIKVMDLIYCPFSKKCGSCDKRNIYTLTDENGRKFPLYRYKTSSCRFELYNCASLVAECENAGTLIDATIDRNPRVILENYKNTEALRNYFKNHTGGHGIKPIY